jgi:tripartite-type tricarboxylate transporter receptor subunit TctC
MSIVTAPTISRRCLLSSAAAFAASLAAPSAYAQAWPQKPVRVLVGFAAGGNIDNLARVTCARLSEVFGQQFVVENRVGAMGTLAANDVVRAPADGYTFFWAGTGTVSIFPALGTPKYDTMKDLAPVSVIGTSPQVLIVTGKLPLKTLAEFVAYVKARPKQLAYAGGGGPGSVSNLLMALFLKRAGLEMNAVSYRGTAPALTDIIGGHVPAMFVPLPEALPHAAAGKIRMLALSDDNGAAGEGCRPSPESGFRVSAA